MNNILFDEKMLFFLKESYDYENKKHIYSKIIF